MESVVEEVIIGIADGDVEFALEFRAEGLPVLFHDEAQVIFFPLFGDAVVNDSGLRVPKRNGPAISAARAIDGVPCAPLFAGHGPEVAIAKEIFDADFAAHGEADVAGDGAVAGPFEAELIDVSISVLVDVDEFEGAEIYAVRTGGPGAVEKIGIEDLQRQRGPTAGGKTGKDASVRRSHGAEFFFNVRNQFLR